MVRIACAVMLLAASAAGAEPRPDDAVVGGRATGRATETASGAAHGDRVADRAGHGGRPNRAAATDAGFGWDAPASCPDGAAVRARIEHRLGGPLELRGIDVAVTKRVTRGGRLVFVGEIDTRAVTVANQVRTLTSSRCDALADAVAVVIARLASEWRRTDAAARAAASRDAAGRGADEAAFGTQMQDPDAVARRDRIARTVALDAEFTTPADVSATGNVTAGRTWGLGVHVMALSGIGTVPRVGVGGELSVFARREDYFAEIGFARWATESAYLVAGAPGRVDVGLDVLTTRLGWSPARMPIRAWLGAEIGTMRGEGASLADAMRGSAPWIAVTGGFGVGWPMTRWARLIGTFEVAIPTSRVDFALAEGGDIYSSSPAAARCALGLELGLP